MSYVLHSQFYVPMSLCGFVKDALQVFSIYFLVQWFSQIRQGVCLYKPNRYLLVLSKEWGTDP